MKNTTDDPINTTVTRWCAAFALGEIAKYNPDARAALIPIFESLVQSEQNNGVRNLYQKTLKEIRIPPGSM
jgi:hypothetical protein